MQSASPEVGIRPDAGANKNYAYAVQWFVMAAAIAVIYVVMNVRRDRSS